MLTLFIIGIIAAIAVGVYKMIVGNYAHYSMFSFISIMLVLILVTYMLIKGIRNIWLPVLIVPLIISCSYAKSNQQVVVSEDCGMTWKRINIGDAVPRAGMNRCYMKVVMPNYPMQGDSRFISNFDGKVRAAVHIDYDYSITDPLAFIKQAKYLGKANADADDDDALNPSAFEGAENMVIDKRIRDVSKSLLLAEDIVELDQAGLEALLFSESNKVLEPLGVKLNFITLTFDLDEQTRQAIDVATAMKIYDSKGLNDIGKAVIAARAGATKITVENKTDAPVKSE